jgi:medium-chain acyl-[acyl-carrier-protein] hydrolase
VQVCAIQLPGRENRFTEPAVRDIDRLADEIVVGIAPLLGMRFGFFGHSMGALVAFEIVRRLRLHGLAPAHFFASACRAPHLPPDRPPYHRLPDPEFADSLRDLRGTPSALIEDGEFMALMLPTLRADFMLAETYAYRRQSPLDCPITVFGGAADTEVSREELESWSVHTRRSFCLHLLPGDHFFLTDRRRELLSLLSDELSR